MSLTYFFLFNQIDSMYRNKEISKIKVNSVLAQEMEVIFKHVTNMLRKLQSQNPSDESELLEKVRTPPMDDRIDELVYFLVNLSENPAKYEKYLTQSIVFSLENKGFSVIRHYVTIIQELNEEVLVKLIELSFKEELDKYQIFSILFKLLRQSEESYTMKSDSDRGSQKSGDSLHQGPLLSILSSKSVVVKALLLALYKSYSQVDNIQAISRLFFMLFLPYAFLDRDPEVVKRVENEIDSLEIKTKSDLNQKESIEQLLIRAIEIEEDVYASQNDNVGMFKGLATYLIEELNKLIGSNLISLQNVIQLSYKVLLLGIPDNLFLPKTKISLESIEQNSIYGFMLEYEYFYFLHEILGLSVKLSIAGDEINEKEQCKKIIDEVWTLMLQEQNIMIVYSFLLFVKYKIVGKSYTKATSENSKMVSMTNNILDFVLSRLQEQLNDADFHLIIAKAMDPVMVVLSKLVIENYSFKATIKNCFEKFNHSSDLYSYIASSLGEVTKVDDLFDSQPLHMDDPESYRAFEYARDFQDFENSLKTEIKSTYFELLSDSKSELEYLSRHFAVVVEHSLISIERFYKDRPDILQKDEQTVCHILTMIMTVLYNYRHIKKIIEEKHESNEPLLRTKKQRIAKDFNEVIQVISTICENDAEVRSYILLEKIDQSTIESASNIFGVLDIKQFLNSNMFQTFTKSLCKMLHSTSIACPHLSVSLVQCWFPLLSNLITVSIKNEEELSSLMKYNAPREVYINIMEALMLAFKRISITKSFEITQVKVYMK